MIYLKIKTWNDNLNDVVRDVLFPNKQLLDMMLVPISVRTDIMTFINKYLVRDVTPDEIVKDEDVRVIYFTSEGRSIGSNMVKKYLNFDIYVKDEHVHDYGNDLLAFRTEVIAEKLKELLTGKRYVCNLRFDFVDQHDLYTKAVGYKRYRITFSYKTSF